MYRRADNYTSSATAVFLLYCYIRKMIYLVHFEDKNYISLLHLTKTGYTSQKQSIDITQAIS